MTPLCPCFLSCALEITGQYCLHLAPSISCQFTPPSSAICLSPLRLKLPSQRPHKSSCLPSLFTLPLIADPSWSSSSFTPRLLMEDPSWTSTLDWFCSLTAVLSQGRHHHPPSPIRLILQGHLIFFFGSFLRNLSEKSLA